MSTPPLDFHTVTPRRIFDTRSSSPLASGVKRTFTIAGARTRANNALVPLASGSVDATVTVEGGGTAHLILDVTGYFE